MTQAERRRRTAAADELCAAALDKALEGPRPASRWSPSAASDAPSWRRSDLDVALVHDDAVDVHRVARKVWYPLLDAAANLDHSVRALSEVTDTARADPRVGSVCSTPATSPATRP